MAAATPTEVISLAGLATFFKDDTNCIAKGEIKFKNGYVLEVKMLGMQISAQVQASMGDRSYKVTLTIDGSGNIISGNCGCARGDWLCSHMAGTAIYVNKNGVSKTDLPNSWISRPRTATKSVSNIHIKDHFPMPAQRKSYNASSRPVDANDLKFLYEKLNSCSLKWMLGPEPKTAVKNVNEPESIEDILEIFMSDKNRFIDMCKVSQEQIAWVAQNTKDQRKSLLWGRLRRLRLTGSNFGNVLDAYNRYHKNGTAYPESLFKLLKGEYNMEGKDPIMWGQMHEDTAIKAYENKTGNRVQDIGLCLFECGFLGSSPDGIVFHTTGQIGVLEVKCPWKYRDSTVDDMLKAEFEKSKKDSKKTFFLKKDGSLNREHSYWHQV